MRIHQMCTRETMILITVWHLKIISQCKHTENYSSSCARKIAVGDDALTDGKPNKSHMLTLISIRFAPYESNDVLQRERKRATQINSSIRCAWRIN